MRRICVFTGTRAEYGLLVGLMRLLRDATGIELQVIVSGSHFAPAFGETWREIDADGFHINERVHCLLADDSEVAVAKSVSLVIAGVAEALDRLKPNILVVLGDRYEAMAAAQAAMLMRIPIAHIHGGEVTEGAMDEAMRHAITKMAQLHFVAAEPYRQRVIQLGEQPERVFLVGSPGVDRICQFEPMSPSVFEAETGIDFASPAFLVTFHPVTLGQDSQAQFRKLLAALDRFAAARILITKANSDFEGRAINKLIDEYAAARKGRVAAAASLGSRLYISALRLADVVIGNSSSGVIEAPAAGKPTVNIGDRQSGRLRAPSVIDVACEVEAIEAAIHKALTPEFQALAACKDAPYGKGESASRIFEILSTIDLSNSLKKRFHDLIPGETNGN